jgi:hypothetical protein
MGNDWGATLSGFSAVESTLDQVGDDWGEDASGVVGSPAEYSAPLEFGTATRKPYPFMRPAVKDVERKGVEHYAEGASGTRELVDEIGNTIERLAKHYASSGVPPGPDVDTGNLRAGIAYEPR